MVRNLLLLNVDLVARFQTCVLCLQLVGHKPACAVTEASLTLGIADVEIRDQWSTTNA